MEDRTPDGTPTVDIGPVGAVTPERREKPARNGSAFDPPAERFEAVGELGRGGMGRVDDAYDRALGRPVAIKHMLSSSAVALGRFEREARITARLEHPGIVPIHDAGRGPDGTPFYVMRRVDGQPLDATLGATLAERLALIPNVLAACDAVAFAHARGVVHRDIKPTNILIGPFGETLVIDWGLAREIGESDDAPAVVQPSDPQLTVAGTVAGTPGFMAPEQARGEAVDARADVFALGATLFYVLSGALPYGAASATEMVDLAGAGREPKWRLVPEDVPPELTAIAAKAMAVDAAERYVDAGALAADLRRFITGNLVGAYVYSAAARFRRFVRRHRAAVAVALVSVIVVGAIAVLSVRRILAERDDATRARALAETRQLETASIRDRLLVERSLELATTDPISAIAALKTLPVESTHWREARVAAIQAYLRGVPFGFASTQNFGYVQIDRAGKRAVVGGWQTGDLVVIDLLARTQRSYGRPCGEIYGLAWVGPNHVLCASSDRVTIVELATGHTRSLRAPVASIQGDHGARVMIVSTDHRLLEIDGPDGELRELASGIDDFAASPDLDEVVLRRGTTFEVWADHRRFQLPLTYEPSSANRTIMKIREHLLVILENYNLHVYRIGPDGLAPLGTYPKNGYIGFNIVGNRLFLDGPEDTTVYEDGVLVGAEKSHGLSFETLGGIVRILPDGAVIVFDRHGSFQIERRASMIRRADASLDGRFVVSVGESGNTLVWDIGDVRPHEVDVDNGTQITRLTQHYIWTQDMLDGTRRIALATGEAEVMIPGMVTGVVLVPEDETWIAAQHPNALFVLDLTTHHSLQLDAAIANEDGAGLSFVKPDGTLWRWRPGRDGATQVAALGRVPHVLAAAPDFVVTVYDNGAVERRRISTGVVEHATFPPQTQLGTLDDGTTWIRPPDGTMHRWDVGAQPVPFTLGGPFDGFVTDRDRIMLYTRRALTLLVGNERYFVPIGSSDFTWAGQMTAMTTNARGIPTVVDMVSGLGFELPELEILGYQPPITRGKLFMIVARQANKTIGFDLWNIDVPEDPVAFRAWLGTITNAQPVTGTTSYQWP